ncbi:uncharacterized protein PGTG_13996 [Puccinia graminis f. sp. tritici CRL 75-36-700-3]|uniref:peptidylprolyl isomerase n=1 Tax=Puccinia graminis f. sp. tritici (strain CRL 75-36-700-3 / race SCCL) TaxID=418459 RepID=E3KVU3_PUCGT|nr:uncharacterized protein PGTG_13996 [Puccinia graminis f. sp. tritici CRL 75-36-700-3]EFP88418.1 hypothetical protein PGTG_13996 [Puccinia graminis f. sp. tritici CRL 75-36-700-3]
MDLQQWLGVAIFVRLDCRRRGTLRQARWMTLPIGNPEASADVPDVNNMAQCLQSINGRYPGTARFFAQKPAPGTAPGTAWRVRGGCGQYLPSGARYLAAGTEERSLIYGLDDFFHVVYTNFLNTQREADVEGQQDRAKRRRAGRVVFRFPDFLRREGFTQSLFSEDVQETLSLNTCPILKDSPPKTSMTRTTMRMGKQRHKERSKQQGLLENSPILLSLAINFKGWPKVYAGLIKMMKGKIFAQFLAMQYISPAG